MEQYMETKRDVIWEMCFLFLILLISLVDLVFGEALFFNIYTSVAVLMLFLADVFKLIRMEYYRKTVAAHRNIVFFYYGIAVLLLVIGIVMQIDGGM